MPRALGRILCPFSTDVVSLTLDIVVDEGGGVSGSPQATANGEDAPKKQGESDQQNQVPDYKTQKTEIHAALQHRLKQGETW